MIFVPKKENAILWNDNLKDIIFIIYPINDNVKLHIEWLKINNKFETYSINIKEISIKIDEYNWDNIIILNCNFVGCQCSPELRYNKIINKWFCFCSSSMICTKDDENDELEYPIIEKCIKNNTLNEENGFFDNPIDALLYWNKQRALEIIDFSDTNMKKEVNYNE
jgi:hypothetical protein